MLLHCLSQHNQQWKILCEQVVHESVKEKREESAVSSEHRYIGKRRIVMIQFVGRGHEKERND